MTTLLWRLSAVMYPVLCLVTAWGLSRARRHSIFCFAFRAPSGSRFLPKQVCKSRHKTPRKLLSCPSQKADLRPWRPAPSLGFALCDPSNNGKFNKRRHDYVQNKVTPLAFSGSDPEVRTNDNRSLTTLSLATKSSYKKDGKYISHTEWHHCVVFGKLAEFAKTLTKGAHIQVEGELRSREYTSKKTDTKQRVWEIRVASILKLDRAEKAAPEDQEHDDSARRRKRPHKPLLFTLGSPANRWASIAVRFPL